MALKRTSKKIAGIFLGELPARFTFEPGVLCCPNGSALFGHARSNSGACRRPTPRGKSSPIHEGADWLEKWQTASFEMPTSKKIAFARKGERHMLLHICCSASATVDVVHLLKIVCSRKV